MISLECASVIRCEEKDFVQLCIVVKISVDG